VAFVLLGGSRAAGGARFVDAGLIVAVVVPFQRGRCPIGRPWGMPGPFFMVPKAGMGMDIPS
jgi:hypothetical protein